MRLSMMHSGVRTELPRSVVYRWDLIRELVVRDIKLRYKRSLLGIAWSLVNPLLQLLVMMFLFGIVLDLRQPRYATFVFTGVLAWTWFHSSLMAAATTIVGNRELIRRPGFPVAVLPAVTVTTNLVQYLLALPVLLVLVLADAHQIPPTALLLPLLIGLQFLLLLGPGYVIAALQVSYRDTWHLLSVFLLLAFYITPVFYDLSAVPEHYRWIYWLNPMTSMLVAYRDCVMHGRMPNPVSLLALTTAAIVFSWLGHRMFMRASYRFAEEV